MSDLLNIGRSGIKAYARSMSTVSNNIANAENPDYVRRSTLLTDGTISSNLNPMYTAQSGLNGVMINGSVRASDEFLEAQLRTSGASRVRSETMVNWLGRIEVGLDNAGANVGNRLNDFFARGEELSAVPFDTALRITFLNELDATVDAFRRTSFNLEQTQDQVVQTAAAEASGLNSALELIAKLNFEITRTPQGTDAHSGLLDSRDSALAVISEKLDVNIVLAGNGVANVTYDGQPLAGVTTFANVTVASNPDASLAIVINGTPARSPTNGTLAGLSRVGAITQQRTTELQGLAQQFVDDVNSWHANGVTDAGAAGAPLLTMTGGVDTLAVTTQAIGDLALASPDGTPNGNLLTLSGLRTPAGVEARWNNLMAGNGSALVGARSQLIAATALDSANRDQRDSVSRVNLDREAADLIRLQQAYEASARVIQVARETMQSILAIF